ncbi:MAG: hypothetical protein FJW26_09295 [Acidimicrobiia bacterium]|nr:hypothetical protein [Acidimicrobiia bacterium]
MRDARIRWRNDEWERSIETDAPKHLLEPSVEPQRIEVLVDLQDDQFFATFFEGILEPMESLIFVAEAGMQRRSRER